MNIQCGKMIRAGLDQGMQSDQAISCGWVQDSNKLTWNQENK